MSNQFHIALVTNYPEHLEQFYKDLFDMSISLRNTKSGYREFSIKTKKIALDIETLESLADDLPNKVLPTHFLRIEVDNVERQLIKCQENNVEIISSILKQNYGEKEFYIKDPDRNIIQIFEVIQ